MIPNNYYISTFIRFSIEQGLREYIYKFIMLFLNEYKTCSLLCFPAPERRVDESYFLLRLVRLDLSKKKKCQRASCMHACACMGDFLRQLARSPCANEFFFKKNKQFRMFLYFAGTVAENTQPCITLYWSFMQASIESKCQTLTVFSLTWSDFILAGVSAIDLNQMPVARSTPVAQPWQLASPRSGGDEWMPTRAFFPRRLWK